MLYLDINKLDTIKIINDGTDLKVIGHVVSSTVEQIDILVNHL